MQTTAYATGFEDALTSVGLTKTSASKLRSMFRITQTTPHLFETTVNGEYLNAVYFDPATQRIHATGSIPEKFEGMGLGKKIYGEIMRRMPNQTLVSDSNVSPMARSVWRGMSRRPGYTLYENPNFEKPGHWGESLFKASLPPQAAIGNAAASPSAPSRARPNTPGEQISMAIRRAEDRQNLRAYHSSRKRVSPWPATTVPVTYDAHTGAWLRDLSTPTPSPIPPNPRRPPPPPPQPVTRANDAQLPLPPSTITIPGM